MMIIEGFKDGLSFFISGDCSHEQFEAFVDGLDWYKYHHFSDEEE